MRRMILSELIKWKNMTADRLPLLIYEARQVGKTYMMKALGAECFKNMVYVNFEADEKIGGFFQTDIHADTIVGMLEKYYHQPVVPEETLYDQDIRKKFRHGGRHKVHTAPCGILHG